MNVRPTSPQPSAPATLRQPLPRGRWRRRSVPLGALVRCSRPPRPRPGGTIVGAFAAGLGGGDEAPSADRTGSGRSRSGMTELNERLRESEERGRRASRRCRGTATSTSASSFRSATAASAGSATPGHAPVPAVLQLLVDVPGRHPGDRDQHARRGRRPGRRARRAPLRQRQLGRRRRLHPERDQPAPALSALRPRDHAREHQLRPPHRIATSRWATSSTRTWASSSTC